MWWSQRGCQVLVCGHEWERGKAQGWSLVVQMGKTTFKLCSQLSIWSREAIYAIIVVASIAFGLALFVKYGSDIGKVRPPRILIAFAC